MKKYSKTKHHELTELNITPLLDLCFVLLVIFILTTAPPVNQMDIALPSAGENPKDVKKVQFVEINNEGKIRLNGDPMRNEEHLRDKLVEFRNENPDLNVVVRADNTLDIQRLVYVLDALIAARIDKFGLATEARSTGR